MLTLTMVSGTRHLRSAERTILASVGTKGQLEEGSGAFAVRRSAVARVGGRPGLKSGGFPGTIPVHFAVRRKLQVPDFLQPYLVRLAKGREPKAALFGEHWRDWPRKWVQRICKAAGVPKVTAVKRAGLGRDAVTRTLYLGQ